MRIFELSGTFGKRKIKADGWKVVEGETVLRFYVNFPSMQETVAFFRKDDVYSVVDIEYKK